MTATEDRLREALAAAAGTVREDTLRPLAVPERRGRRWPRPPFCSSWVSRWASGGRPPRHRDLIRGSRRS